MKIHVPLLRDRHSHPLLYASWMDGLDLSCVSTLEVALTRIRTFQFTKGEILVAYGWLDSKFDIGSYDLIELPPVAVFNLSLHGLVMNDSAKQLVEQELHESNCPWNDQHWFEKNLRRILNAFAILNGNVQRLRRFYDWLETSCGVVYAEEMLLASEKEIELFQEAQLLDRTRFWCSIEMLQQLSPNSKQQIQGIKIFADGALGVRTAAVHRPFDTGDRGMLLYSDAELERLFAAAVKTDKSIAIHAIGDRAIDQVVALVTKQRKLTGFSNEVRIEHAQLIDRETAFRAKAAGVILSMQPNFSIDSSEYADRLPEEYCLANNPFRMLIDEVGFVPGEDLIFGSDGMPHGIQEAIRQALFPPYPDRQRLSIEEFTAGYCDNRLHASETTIEIEIDHQNRTVVFSL